MENCPLCQKTFKDKSGLTGHMRFSHPTAGPVAAQELVGLQDRISSLENLIGGINVDTVITEKDLLIRDLRAEVATLKDALSGDAVTKALRKHLAECAACRKAATDLMSDNKDSRRSEKPGA